ncbi:retroviral-like aspartic protease family protein [Roseimarinus sediminis]|uniref:retroviral-like aspartic protease family protein n=1 Tax=Roseimarinus sediminis TaxID=1610899 RepID=UPI003D1E90FD
MKKYLTIIVLLTLITNLGLSQIRIKMQQENGVYSTFCFVNDLKLKFIFDTGASNVSISLTEALFMLKNEYLSESDLYGSTYTQLANGEIVENTVIKFKELKIDQLVLDDVEAIVVHELFAPLLLGQTVINRLGKIQINGDEMLIMDADSSLFVNSNKKARELINEAKVFLGAELFTVAASTFKEAYDLSPDEFSCYELELFGNSYWENGFRGHAIEYYKKAINCAEDKHSLCELYGSIGYYYHMWEKDLTNAIINLEKSLFYAQTDWELAESYLRLANAFKDTSVDSKTIKYYEKCLIHMLKARNLTEEDVMEGKATDVRFQGIYSTLADIWKEIGVMKTSNDYLIKAAACGSLFAIEECNKLGLNYKE